MGMEFDVAVIQKMTEELLASAINTFGLYNVSYELSFDCDEHGLPEPRIHVYEDYWGVPDGERLGHAVFENNVVVVSKTKYGSIW